VIHRSADELNNRATESAASEGYRDIV